MPALKDRVTPVIPLAHLAYSGLAAGGFQALLDDARLFGVDWGFRLADVNVPVKWWHGNADSIISLADAQAAVAHLPDVELLLMP